MSLESIMRKSLLAIPAVLAMAASAVAFAGGGFHHHHSAMLHELRQLSLTDDQKASIKQMAQASFAQAKTQRQALFQQRLAFESATPGTAAYQTAAAALAQSEASAASARVTSEAALETQVYGILTDAQKTQFASLQAQHQAKVAQWQAARAASSAAELN